MSQNRSRNDPKGPDFKGLSDAPAHGHEGRLLQQDPLVEPEAEYEQAGDELHAPVQEESTGLPTSGGPLSILMPVETTILLESRRMASNRNIRVDRLATCISQDPILVLELLRLANAMFFVQDRPPITVVETAVIRLGSANVVTLLDQVGQRPQFKDKDTKEEFENLRTLGRRISFIARIMSTVVNRELADEAHSVGLMSTIGHLLACAYFGKTYVELSNSMHSRASLVYQLSRSHNFNLRLMQINYLRRQSFPEILLFALDREIQCRTPERTAMRFVIESAVEMVEAYDSEKWERYTPGRDLPHQSSVRLLGMPDKIYETVFDRCSEYLDRTKKEEELKLLNSLAPAPVTAPEVAPRPEIKQPKEMPSAPPPEATQLHSMSPHTMSPNFANEIEESLRELSKRALHPIKELDTSELVLKDFKPRRPSNTPEETIIPLGNSSGSLRSVVKRSKPVFIVADAPENRQAENHPSVYEERINEVLAGFKAILREVKNTEELLQKLLTMLITDGPFVRAALIVVEPTRMTAKVHTSVGDGLLSGATLQLDDPLSPLAACLTSIRSFNSHDLVDKNSPLGISSYAVSPIDIKGEGTVILYTDCGTRESLTFEARRVFRNVIALLNSTLKDLPGGLPKPGVIPLS